jgi:hypothetical protein
MTQSGGPADAGRPVSLSEKFARLPASPPFPRVALAPRTPIDALEGAALMRARTRASGIGPWMFVTATAISTAVASILAVLITLAVVNQEPLGAPPGVELQDAPPPAAPAVLAPARPAVVTPPGPVPAPPAREFSLRQIGSPDRPLQLEPQRPASLPLQIEPDEGAGEPFILTLSGAPAGTILFGANRISSDTWLLPPGAAGRLEIVLPEWSTQVFEIAVVLRRTGGAVAAQTTAFIAVPPPAGVAPVAAPAGDPPADTATRDLTRDLLAKADRLVAKGDIVGARALYQRAAELGSAPAALALGTTYDPNRLWSLGVLGLAGSRERARQWYVRASELGNAEAKARLMALGFSN